MDYRNPFQFHDLCAQRDAEGYYNGLPFFLIFSKAGQGFSRSDMLHQKHAVRVKACWGGMVAMRARDRTVQEGDRFMEGIWSVEKQAWEMVERIGRNGLFCGVRETQLIMTGNREQDKNWDNTVIPPGQRLRFPS